MSSTSLFMIGAKLRFARYINNHPQSGWFCFHYHQPNPGSLTPNGIHPNGGVRGGTIRLLPVDSKAEAKRSSLLSS